MSSSGSIIKLKNIFQNRSFFYFQLAWFLLFLFNFLFIFNFQGIADFRDSKFLPNNHIANPFYSLAFWLQHSLKFWSTIGFEIPLFWRFLYSLVFSFGIFTSYIFLKKILLLIVNSKNFARESSLQFNSSLDSKTNLQSLDVTIFKNYFFSSFLAVIIGIYFFNPFIFERFFMGQYFFLFGHSFFIPVLYFVLKWTFFVFKKDSKITKFFQDLDFWQMFFVLVILFCISSHHSIFLSFVLIFITFVLFLYRFFSGLKLLSKSTSLVQAVFNLDNLKIFLLLFTIFLLFLGIYIRWIPSYFNNVLEEENQAEIINRFSLQTFDANFAEHLILGSVGKGSWMSGMVEINRIARDLGFLLDFSFYYNFFMQFLLVLVVALGLLILLKEEVFDILSFKNKTGKRFENFNFLLIFIFSLGFFSWFLTFGYSRDFFKFFNQAFYFLPGFYTFREAGKFYSFFLAFLCILCGYYFYKLFLTSFLKSKNLLVFSFLVLLLLLLSNLLPFFLISKNLNYIKYPAIFADVNNYCQNNPKDKNFIFISTDLYLVTSYSRQVFTVNPSYFYFSDCNFLDLDKASLENLQNQEAVVLNQSKMSEELDILFQKLVDEEISKQDFNFSLKDFLRKNKVGNIIIETYTNNKVKEINQSLQIGFELKKSEGTIFWYGL
jgi:hypothetical protein